MFVCALSPACGLSQVPFVPLRGVRLCVVGVSCVLCALSPAFLGTSFKMAKPPPLKIPDFRSPTAQFSPSPLPWLMPLPLNQALTLMIFSVTTKTNSLPYFLLLESELPRGFLVSARPIPISSSLVPPLISHVSHLI